jgi:alkanesulfonate monooxygenase SsuD/methylene tetrahydromethanopterin reductase-like flavin-dependent oxidoreductase (luciferase family)
MRIGAVLSPVAEWSEMLDAARVADAEGFDSVGLWGHYQSGRPEWAYISGWTAYGALATVTTGVRLVPMVLNNLHYQPGVLAKETAQLAIASDGRFELGIGGGDWPDSFAAWGVPYPEPAERIGRLVESIEVLTELWKGREVTIRGRYVMLEGACVTPAPEAPPRVVVGVGASLSTARAVVGVADELNVYEGVIDQVRQIAEEHPRRPDVSLFLSWEWDKWPADAVAQLEAWRSRGIDRVFVSLGADDMPVRLRQLAPLLARG